jgi:hypothetical protein
MVWTVYYDDYPAITPLSLAANTQMTMRVLFDLLGWQVAWGDEKKDLPFSQSFTALGVVIGLEHMKEKRITVANKPSRIKAMVELVEEVLSQQSLAPSLAAELAGKFNYAEGQIFGRIARPSLSVLFGVASGRVPRAMSGDLSTALRWLSERVARAAPRTLDCTGEQRPLLLFTDGAAEGVNRQDVTIGGVLIDTVTQITRFYGCAVDPSLVRCWQSGGSQQVIGQGELLPVLLSRRLWKEEMQGRRVFAFVDNDSARDSLVAAFSPSAHSMNIIYRFLEMDLSSVSHFWFARVPSKSNIADGPSRLDFDEVSALPHSTRVDVSVQASLLFQELCFRPR